MKVTVHNWIPLFSYILDLSYLWDLLSKGVMPRSGSFLQILNHTT